MIDEKTLIDGLNYQIQPGQMKAIMGQNGSGKSTLANFIAGKPGLIVAGGEATIDSSCFYNPKTQKNIDLRTLSSEMRSKYGIYVAYQNPVDLVGIAPISYLKTIFNEHRKHVMQAQVDSSEFIKILKEKIKQAGLNMALVERGFIQGMSGGEKKYFELLQILLLNPRLVILDEIDSGLDVDGIKKMSEIVAGQRSNSTSWVLISHSPEVVEYFSPDSVDIMVGGQIVDSGGIELSQNIAKRGFKDYA